VEDARLDASLSGVADDLDLDAVVVVVVFRVRVCFGDSF